MAKAKELENKSKGELENLLKDKREALRRFRFGLVQGKAKNTKAGRSIRREVARILTRLNLLDTI